MGHLPENVFQHIWGQRGGAEHNKQALLGLAVGRSEFLQRGQVDICLNPGHSGDSRETLVDTNRHPGSVIQLKHFGFFTPDCIKPTGQILYYPYKHQAPG